MSMDKEGNRIIKQGLEEDKARYKEQLRKELEAEYQPKFDAIIGSGTLRTEAEKAVIREREQAFNTRYKEGCERLEKLAYGEQGEDHANKMAEREARIQGAQDRWREQDRNNETTRSAWSKSPHSLSYKLNEQATKEERLKDIKERWRQQDEAREREQDKDRGGIDI